MEPSEKTKRPRRWTKAGLIDEIRVSGELDLSAKQVQRRSPSLYGAAVRLFGSWKSAVEAAGLDYASVAKRRLPGHWTREKVILEIRELPEKYSGFARKRHAALYAAALRLFTSWRSAVEAAGFDYEALRKYSDRK